MMIPSLRASAPVLRLLVLVLLLISPFSGLCRGETLHQRSSVLLAAKARKAPADDFSFVVLGDSRGGDRTFSKLLELARSYNPLFILHAGDYSDEGSETETAKFLALLQRQVPELPIFVVIGNHENREIFPRYVGPLNFTLDIPRLGFRLVALDNADGELRPPEQELLRGELASAPAAVFAAMHIPPRTGRWRGHTFKKGAEQLEMILKGSRAQGLFFAHSHLYDRSVFAGIPAFIAGGAGAPLVWFTRNGETVYHILVVRVRKGKASYQMVPLREEPHRRR
ncbi:Metallophosphoesterase [Citrifermentans bremense]|uniref:Metallophosphoesterase n=1 Tax=Citrifermentans bremense TaxID=60035 RepID=A0A7R7J089_9BACT|nr:Metallophosphoesterase [Citrifermentans bremense]